MIDTIYVEDAVAMHTRSREIIARFKDARIVQCRHYGEVFNRRKQNFRLQKIRPALILARKLNRRVLPVPAGYGIDGARGYYFSHMLNCLYDCRYCFLQGMFRSAHYVLFVNYEEFIADIERVCGETAEDVWFFSGYDCDSLALDPVTGFVDDFVPTFAKLKNAWLELRTKSTQIRRAIPDLDSTLFVVDEGRDGDGTLREVRFVGGGWGHGVGMCQMGTYVRALESQRFDEILEAYFTDAELRRIY